MRLDDPVDVVSTVPPSTTMVSAPSPVAAMTTAEVSFDPNLGSRAGPQSATLLRYITRTCLQYDESGSRDQPRTPALDHPGTGDWQVYEVHATEVGLGRRRG